MDRRALALNRSRGVGGIVSVTSKFAEAEEGGSELEKVASRSTFVHYSTRLN